MSPFLGNRGTKLYKLDEENIVSKFMKRGTNYENVCEHRATLEENKVTRRMRSRFDCPYSAKTRKFTTRTINLILL